jgi:hypothetical protein
MRKFRLKQAHYEAWRPYTYFPTVLGHYVPHQTPWPLVRKRNIPTEPPPLVGEIYCQLLRIEGCRVVGEAEPPRPLISLF